MEAGDVNDPVHKLVLAILLGSIKKGARAIRVVTSSPMRVFFDFGDTCLEEMRPPDMLRDRMLATLYEMSGASAREPGHITLLIGDNKVEHHFDATLRGDTFRIVRIVE
jgi:hypothetical protein